MEAKWGDRDADQMKLDRKSTRLNSSHLVISYAVFCLQKNIYREHGGPRGTTPVRPTERDRGPAPPGPLARTRYPLLRIRATGSRWSCQKTPRPRARPP